jgi:putative transposase
VTHTDQPNPVQMFRSYKFLLRLTSKQLAAITAMLEDHRMLYNAALEERREAWRMRKVSCSFYSQDAQLKEIRAADPRYARWAFTSERATIRRLDRAFAAFFRRVKAGESPGFPRFKGHGRFDSVEWEEGSGSRWDADPHGPVTRLHLKGIGHVRVHQHRPVAGRVKTVTVKREGNRWFVILSCADVPSQPLPATGAVVGIDMGVTHFLTTSDGAHIANPRYGKVSAGALAGAQREFAKFPQRKDRTRPQRAAGAKIAKLHLKIRRQRLDHAHKAAHALVRDHDVICHEALPIQNMTRRPKPRPVGDGTYEPNGSAAKAGLNRSINDAGWGILLRILAAKAESAGRMVIAVNPRYTSQRCAQCGHVAKGNRKEEAFRCLACGHEAHADVNAAINILRAGLARQAAQAA